MKYFKNLWSDINIWTANFRLQNFCMSNASQVLMEVLIRFLFLRLLMVSQWPSSLTCPRCLRILPWLVSILAERLNWSFLQRMKMAKVRPWYSMYSQLKLLNFKSVCCKHKQANHPWKSKYTSNYKWNVWNIFRVTGASTVYSISGNFSRNNRYADHPDSLRYHSDQD